MPLPVYQRELGCAIVDADGDDVVAGDEMFGDVVGESDVAVRAAAQEYTVDPDVTVHVHAIEFQPRLDPRARVDPERLAIPPDAGGEIADAPAAGRGFGRCAFDTPIVRQIERAPARVVERPVLRTVGIAEGEAPTGVERGAAAVRGRGGGRRGCGRGE